MLGDLEGQNCYFKNINVSIKLSGKQFIRRKYIFVEDKKIKYYFLIIHPHWLSRARIQSHSENGLSKLSLNL